MQAAANPFDLLACADPPAQLSHQAKSKNRRRKSQKSKGINSKEHSLATLDRGSPIVLPSEAETPEVIQKQGIFHARALGSILQAPFSFLFSFLLHLFNVTFR